MTVFDQAHTYQFFIFFADESKPDAAGQKVLGQALSAPSGDVLALKFPPRGEMAATISLQAQGQGPAALTQMPALSWTSGPWRAVLADARLEVSFDVSAYAVVAGSRPTLEAVARRILPNLARVPELLQQPAQRLALIVTGKGSPADGRAAIHDVASAFLNNALISASSSGDVADLSVRINRTAEWDLGDGASPVYVNRNETAAANYVGSKGQEELSLLWQWDINTSALRQSIDTFSGANISSFFTKAVEWAQERGQKHNE